jgi:hypothetical protein
LIPAGVYGASREAAGAYVHSRTDAALSLLGSPSVPVKLWFACDGTQGWWWLHGLKYPDDTMGGFFVNVGGMSSRRYAADTYQGICARYGLYAECGEYWSPPYTRDWDWLIDTAVDMNTWSPLGHGWDNNQTKHASNPLPKLVVPVFPLRDGFSDACILGELDAVMVATTDYAHEEVPFPGWIVLYYSAAVRRSIALRAPDTFDVL